jgi:hypothetical protein
VAIGRAGLAMHSADVSRMRNVQSDAGEKTTVHEGLPPALGTLSGDSLGRASNPSPFLPRSLEEDEDTKPGKPKGDNK